MTTTHPSANDSGLNLDHLEALARAATPGPWSLAKVIDRSIEHLCPVDRDRLSLLTVVHEGETQYGAVFRDEDAKFMAGIHPEQVLALIALARAALAHQPAQEQASTTRVTETKRAQLEARGYEVVGYVMQNSVNELCTLAHGRVEWLGKSTVTDYGPPAQQEPVAAPQQAAAPDALDGWNAAAKALAERAAGHFRNKDFELQDECLQCASMLHDLKPARAATSAPGTPEAPSQLMQALTTGIPLQEPVYIAKALRAQREVRVSLAGGTGPGAAAFLANIQMTPWTYTKETAEAYAWGYNRALKDYRAALLDVAAQLDGGQGGAK